VLALSKPIRFVSSGVYQIGHRLSLGQINPAVHKGAFCKFARARRTASCQYEKRHYAAHRYPSAMTRYLNNIVTSERPRRPEYGDNHIVDNFSPVHDFRPVQRIAGALCARRPMPQYSVGNFERGNSGNSNYR
jgi:hypothetical protein